MKLTHRIAALEKQIQPPPQERRVLQVWVDEEGRLTHSADWHPELPADMQYDDDLVSGAGLK
jgi:hypothetical protein